jgi:hypothetical protein
VNPRELAVVQGWADTRATLRAWKVAPGRVLGRWALGSLAIAATLLVATWLVASIVTPDPTPVAIRGIDHRSDMGDVLFLFGRNLLVLALHAMACVAGFIAKSTLPREAEAYTGWWRRVHDHAGGVAIAFVTGATLFSLATQALALGISLAQLSFQLGITPAEMLLTVLPHAVPELLVLFLPLAAWIVAARAGAWNELLAATLVTTAIGVPVLFGAALIETYVTPHLLRTLHFV